MTKKLFLILPVMALALVAGLYGYANFRVKNLVDERIDSLVSSGAYQAVDYDTVNLTYRGEIVLENLHVIDAANHEYVLEHIQVSNFDFYNDTPRHLLLTASGIRFPAGIPSFGDTPNPVWRTYLENTMIADSLPVTVSYRYEFEPQDNARLDSHVTITLPDGFFLSSDTTIHNPNLMVQDIPVATGTTGTAAWIEHTDIPSATLAFRDYGLVEDLLSIQGQDFGLDGEQYRQQLLAQLQTMVLFTPRQLQGMAQDYLGRLADFLQGNRTLRISIAPEYGGNVQQLQQEIAGAMFVGNFARIRDLLHLEIETLP